MAKKIKKTILLLAIALWGVFAVSLYLVSNNTAPAFAGDMETKEEITNKINEINPENGILLKEGGQSYICDEPIPIGNAVQETLKVLNDIYRQVQDTRNYLKIAINRVNSEISDIYRDPKESDGASVCDFSVCRPEVLNKAPNINLRIDFGFTTRNLFGIRPPLCSALQCSGEPCADIDDYYDSLVKMKAAIANSHEIVKKIFTEKNYTVNYDIAIDKNGKSDQGRKISRFDYIRRLIRLARAWFHPPGEGIKRTCVLSEKQKKEAERGQRSDVFPLPCQEAIAMNIYWPKPWSEQCQDECKNGIPTEECKQCLGSMNNNPSHNKNGSFLSLFNYRVYGPSLGGGQGFCGEECSKDIQTEKCQLCLRKLISSNGKAVSLDDFIKYICGNSEFNFACCHKVGEK